MNELLKCYQIWSNTQVTNRHREDAGPITICRQNDVGPSTTNRHKSVGRRVFMQRRPPVGPTCRGRDDADVNIVTFPIRVDCFPTDRYMPDEKPT